MVAIIIIIVIVIVIIIIVIIIIIIIFFFNTLGSIDPEGYKKAVLYSKDDRAMRAI